MSAWGGDGQDRNEKEKGKEGGMRSKEGKDKRRKGNRGEC